MKTKCANYVTKSSVSNILIETRKYRALLAARQIHKPNLNAARAMRSSSDNTNKVIISDITTDTTANETVPINAGTLSGNITAGIEVTNAKMEANKLTTIKLPIFKKVQYKRSYDSDQQQESTRKKMVKPSPSIPLQNRYSPLEVEQDNMEIAEEDENESVNGNENSSQQRIKETTRTGAHKSTRIAPPPIIIHGKTEDTKQLITYVQDKVKKGFRIKHTSASTNIYIDDIEEWRVFKDTLHKTETEYHSYTHKQDRTHAFVLRGLDHAPEPEQIERELKETHNIKVVKCYKMNGTKRPSYLITTDSEHTLRSISKIRAIDYTMISWERYLNNKRIIQCHRCQAWGHATSNCHAAPKCLKCAQDHQTKDCLKTDKDTPAKCINCEGPHPANSIDCPVYKKKIEMIDNRKGSNKQTLRAHPVAPNIHNEQSFPALRHRTANEPARNPWNDQLTAPRMTQTSRFQEASCNNTTSEFSELTTELRNLSELVNIKGMLAAIRDLNKQLVTCVSKQEKLTVFLQFTQNLDSYEL